MRGVTNRAAINVFSISPTNDNEYRPEFVNNYELGAKSTLAGGAVYVAAAAFFLDYTDLQVNQLVNVGGVPTFHHIECGGSGKLGRSNWRQHGRRRTPCGSRQPMAT